jgi:hypothetical protein
MKQWQAVRAYANEKGIRIMGDIPIYVAYDSCDVWANRDQFQLDKDGRPTSVAGCPPDYFSEDGQFWGNPLYDWKRMAKDGFAWWSARIRHMLTLFDGVRIDHFRGLETYWSIPADAKTAKEGHWEAGPREAFIRMLYDVVDACEAKTGKRPLIVAEDLGDSTPALEKFVRVQSDAALRQVAGQYAYDDEDGSAGELTLRSGSEDINRLLEQKLDDRLALAGIEVIEARINYLAYAPEIAAVMLRRQQASAIITAREKIVDGAVSMVKMALDKLSNENVVELDDEKKATMVSNLLVVLCSDDSAQPVVNAGT